MPLVGGGGGGKPGFVYAVVDLVVGPFVRFVDLRKDIGGDEVDFLVLWRDQIVKLTSHKHRSLSQTDRENIPRYTSS